MSKYLIQINDKELDLIVSGLTSLQKTDEKLSKRAFKLKQDILLMVIAQIGADIDDQKT